jgi:hypothetical protein
MFHFWFTYVGWEFHAYLVQVRESGVTIFEPTDKIVLPWTVGVFGIGAVKAAYYITVTPIHVAGKTSLHHNAKQRDVSFFLPHKFCRRKWD